MRAAYYTGNRSFSLEPARPQPPAAGEVRLDVAYCGICGTDLHVYLGHMDKRVGNRRIIGHEMSGVVAELGPAVDGFAVGDRVVVRPLGSCGRCPACTAGHDHICHNLRFLGLDTDGAMQSSWTVPASVLHRLPAALDLRHAALVEPVAVACHDVQRSRLAFRERALVIGFGPIGTLIALVAREAGGRVTVAEVNPARRAMAEALGFACVDPQSVDAAALIDMTDGKGFDVVFEVAGAQPAVDLAVAAAAARGRIVMVAIHSKPAELDLFRVFWRELELLGARVYRPDDFEQAIRLLASGTIPADRLITETIDLDHIAEAFDGAHRGMKTLLSIGGSR